MMDINIDHYHYISVTLKMLIKFYKRIKHIRSYLDSLNIILGVQLVNLNLK
jgi:hypothetical protein